MDELSSYRERLAEVVRRLDRVEAERAGLLTLAKTYETLLRLLGEDSQPVPEPAPAPPRTRRALPKPLPPKPATSPGRPSSRKKGTVSLRSAVLQVVKAARGQPLHAKEIYARAHAMGAITTGRDPAHIMDLVLYSARKRDASFERVGPMTWRWVGK